MPETYVLERITWIDGHATDTIYESERAARATAAAWHAEDPEARFARVWCGDRRVFKLDPPTWPKR